MDVYSVTFMQQQGLSGSITYTVPAGYVAVIRDADFYVAADLTGSIDVRLLGAAGQTIFWATTDVDTTTNPQWRGRQVMNAGQTFAVTTTGAADVSVSGYLLSLP